MIFGNPYIDGLLAIAAIVGAVGVIWTKAIKPVVTMANRVVELVETVEAVKEQVTPVADDPFGHIRLVDRVSMVGKSAEAAVAEAHAASSAITDHAAEDRRNFEAVAEWSQNFSQFDPIELPDPA